jgi:hypothetical protein
VNDNLNCTRADVEGIIDDESNDVKEKFTDDEFDDVEENFSDDESSDN